MPGEASRKNGTKGGRPKGPTRRTLAIRRQLAAHEELTAARTVEEIRRLALSDIGACLDDQGRLKPMKDLPVAVRAAIGSIKVTKKNLTAGDGKQEDVVELKLWDKLRALEMAAKHHGLLIEKVELSGELSLLARVNRARARVKAARDAS